jgi:hypothetical protein
VSHYTICFAELGVSDKLRCANVPTGEENVFKKRFTLVVCHYASLPVHGGLGERCAIKSSGPSGNGLSALGLRMLFRVGRAPAIEWLQS